MNANEHDLRREIVRIGRLIYEKGFISASDGNISARLAPDRLLITPSGLHKGFLEPEQLLVVTERGEPLGPRRSAGRQLKPTSELPMHLEAYRQRPEIGAVLHAHPPITIALSVAGVSLADCILPEAIVMLGIIPTTAYATPSSEENMLAIRNLIRRHDGIVLQRHGSLTVGTDPMQAFMRLETMEQTANVSFRLVQLGALNPLPPEQVRKLLRTREEMGLCRPGEAEAFCERCGVCHFSQEHAPTMRYERAQSGNAQKSSDANPGDAGAPDEATVRKLVAQIVNRSLGDPTTDEAG